MFVAFPGHSNLLFDRAFAAHINKIIMGVNEVFRQILDLQSNKIAVHSCLTICIWGTPKRVLLQTVKTHMKCCIMRHFIRVNTVCKGKKDIQTRAHNFLKIYIT